MRKAGQGHTSSIGSICNAVYGYDVYCYERGTYAYRAVQYDTQYGTAICKACHRKYSCVHGHKACPCDNQPYKVQQHRSPLLSAIRNISLADAGVSAVTLIRSLTVYAMWLSESDKLIIITCSGVIVYLTTLVLGVAMLLRHTDESQSTDKNAPITADNSCDASKSTQ